MSDLKCSYCGSNKRVARFKGGDLLCIKHYLQMYTYGKLFERGKSRNTNSFIADGADGIIITAKKEHILVDSQALPMLSKHSWCLNSQGYAVARINKKTIRLNRFVLGITSNEFVVDHINGNRLDNRLQNLRICSAKENSRNSGLAKNNRTGVTGVSLNPKGKYRARIMVDRKEIALGVFDSLDEAKKARSEAERFYFGEYARKAKS